VPGNSANACRKASTSPALNRASSANCSEYRKPLSAPGVPPERALRAPLVCRAIAAPPTSATSDDLNEGHHGARQTWPQPSLETSRTAPSVAACRHSPAACFDGSSRRAATSRRPSKISACSTSAATCAEGSFAQHGTAARASSRLARALRTPTARPSQCKNTRTTHPNRLQSSRSCVCLHIKPHFVTRQKLTTTCSRSTAPNVVWNG